MGVLLLPRPNMGWALLVLFSVDLMLVARACFRGIPFHSGLSMETRVRAAQTGIAYYSFAAPGAFVNAVTQLGVRVVIGDLEIVSP